MFPSIQVSVESAPDGPVVVKTAVTDEGIARLAIESERLDRAAHPGVVEVVHHREGRLVLAWAGGQTLASYQAPFGQLAAVLASLSSTIADLHDLGIVHGAIQADHVIIGADGRPRLCGFGGPVGRADRIGPADDVAAMGTVITDLVGDAAEIEPIPDRRWGRRRWSGYLRRALLTLADQAADADPAHRPTARTLATSIADAVPDARIEPSPTPDLPLGPAPIDPADLIDPVEPLGVDEDSDDPHLPQSTGVAPDIAPDALVVLDHRTPGGHGHREDHGADSDDHEAAESEAGSAAPQGGAVGSLGAVGAEGPTGARRVLGLRTDEPYTFDGEATIDADRLRPAPRPRPGPNDATSTGTRHSWRAATGVGAAAAVLALVGLTLWPGTTADRVATQPMPPPPAPGVEPSTPDGSTPPTAGSAGDGCVQVSGPVADVDGDGCQEPVAVDATVITAGLQTFEVGEAGDALSVGDWDCDGEVTPGLVRPETGEIFLFASWPADRAGITIDASTVIPDAVRLAPNPNLADCAAPTVVLADGGHRSVGRVLP